MMAKIFNTNTYTIRKMFVANLNTKKVGTYEFDGQRSTA